MQPESLEQSLSPGDQLCFIHIMKTAGSTLTPLLDAKFHLQAICPSPAYLEEINPAAKPGLGVEAIADLMTTYSFIRGNFSYREIAPYVKRPVYLTMIRHPIDRVISFYEYIKRIKEPPKREDTRAAYEVLRDASSGSLLDFVCYPHPIVQESVSNHQMRQLAPAIDASLSDEEQFILAQKTLDSFAWVGVTERFQDSLFLLSYIFGWYPIVEYANLKVAPDRPQPTELDAETLDALMQCNQLDLKLYEQALERLDQCFSTMVERLHSQYGQAEDGLESDPSHSTEDNPVLLSGLHQHYEQRWRDSGRESVQSLNFEFTQPFSGEGWHRRRGSHNGLVSTGPMFRWTGPSTVSTLDFPLVGDRDYRLKIRITNAAAPDVLESLQIKVNGVPLEYSPLLHEGSLRVIEAIIPRQVLSPGGLTRLSFEVNRTLFLQVEDPSSPRIRQVGIAVQRIQLFPAAAQPGDRDYRYMVFPLDDPAWMEAATFIQQHRRPAEQIAAPSPFAEQFPDRVCPNTGAFLGASDLAWVIVQKNELAAIDSASLSWVVTHFHPVFANPVFVIFSHRSDLVPLAAFSTHLRPFWKQWVSLKLRHEPVSQWGDVWRVLVRSK